MRICCSFLTASLLSLLLFGAAEGAWATSAWEEPPRGIPLITSYDLPPTRHNGEVWGFAAAEAGRLWVGSDELFLFDGESRERVALPFETYAVRALAYDASGKLWIGAIGDIGHLERTATGGWNYISAHAELQAAGINNVRVWEALATPQGVVFVTADHLLRWNGTRFECWPMRSSGWLRATRDHEGLWIIQPRVGLFRMDTDGPRHVLASADLPDPLVNWAVGSPPTNGTAGIGPFLVGGGDRVFRWADGRWVKLDRLSAAIAGKSAWRAVLLDEHTVAIGTAVGGVIIGTTDDRVLAVLDRAGGLPNEAVTSLWLDERNRQLWIGYVGGMSRVDARGAASVFDTRNGLNDTPAQKAVLHDGRTYVFTQRNVSVLSAPDNGRTAIARPLKQLPVPFLDALSIGPNLWVGGRGGGLWRIIGDQTVQEMPISTLLFAMAETRISPDELFYIEGTRVKALTARAEGGWKLRDLDAEIGASSISAVRDGGGDLWISTVTQGIVRFRVDRTPAGSRLQLGRRYHAGDGLPKTDLMRPVLTTLAGRVFALSEQGIFGYDPLRDAFVPVPGLEKFVALTGATSDDPTIAYWVVRYTDLNPRASGAGVLIRLQVAGPNSWPSWEPVDTVALDHAGRISGLNFTGGETPALWIAGSQALVRLSASALSKPPTPSRLALRAISRNGVPQEHPTVDTPLQLAADTTRLRIELAGVKRADGHALLVQGLLQGASNDWSSPQSEPVFEFTGLRPGAYTFKARPVDSFGRDGPELSLAFMLAPPWYQSAPAFVAYAVAGLLAVGAAVRWRLRHLHHLTERLNRLVDERTAELAQANVARNEFLEAISHEIRNPLNGITNLVDLLHDAKLNPEAQKLAHSLGKSADHLKQVFGDVLGYTKLEYGHVDINRVDFSLKELLEDTIALFAVQGREQQVELRSLWPSDLAEGFCGDAEKIQTVIHNYVSNALKYAPAGTIDIAVRQRANDSQESISRIWIGVRDCGPGLSPEEQKNLFKKFARGQAAKTRGISGTGLGLAICRGVADLLDGKVGVTSEVGKGATFWLEVPLARATQFKAHAAAPRAEASRTASKTDRPEALIVDDQDYNQAVLRGIAHRLGYRAEVASRAEEVWPLIERIRFQVVFLDWELPGLSGGDIARHLRVHPNSRDAVIIATTAHDTDDIVQQCLESGMDGFAAKPFDTAQMRAIVSEAAARRADRSSPGAAARPSPHAADAAAPGQLTLTAFADFAAGDPARAQQAVTLYLDTLDQEIEQLRVAISANDREAVASRAHRLRSHAGLVNAASLNVAAQKLMLAARSDSTDAWRACTQAVFDEAATLRAAVEHLAAEAVHEARPS